MQLSRDVTATEVGRLPSSRREGLPDRPTDRPTMCSGWSVLLGKNMHLSPPFFIVSERQANYHTELLHVLVAAVNIWEQLSEEASPTQEASQPKAPAAASADRIVDDANRRNSIFNEHLDNVTAKSLSKLLSMEKSSTVVLPTSSSRLSAVTFADGSDESAGARDISYHSHVGGSQSQKLLLPVCCVPCCVYRNLHNSFYSFCSQIYVCVAISA